MAEPPEPPTLVVLHVSPWSERARWALDHHGVSYRLVLHAPFLGEGRLRKMVGRREGRATVPVLIDGDAVLTESWDIALHADRIGRASKLIPTDREAEVRRWTDLADETATAGRALVVAALLRSPAALDESVPPPAPKWLRPLLRPMTRYGTRWFARKYGLGLEDLAGPEQKMRSTLDALRAGLTAVPHLLGELSYADIAMASLLQAVEPVADEHIPLEPATRAVWTNAAIAREYADLVRWRDELYARHRKPRARP